MIQIGNYIYELCITGDWVRCGKIINGVDTDYIEWFV
jgi:hypothetical protein